MQRSQIYTVRQGAELHLMDAARRQMKLIGWGQSCGLQIEADVSEEIDLHGQTMPIKDWRTRCLAEFGLVARRGARNIRELADLVGNTSSEHLPDAARAMLILLLQQIREAQIRVRQTEHALEAWAKQSDACRRLMSIPGVGSISATALVLAMHDAKRFRSGRHFAAWLGLVPR